MQQRYGGSIRYGFIVLATIAFSSFLAAANEMRADEYAYRYHNYEESTTLLRNLVSRYPSLARLYSLGKTVTGRREIWCMEITNQAEGVSEEKPAVYFDGNQHDIEVMSGETTLYLTHHLLTSYGKDPDVTRLVDTRVVYIIQRADPDGAEAYLSGKIDWDPGKVPGRKDEDGDGRFGEDGPEDTDGDGEILQMRIADPEGEWTINADDDRIMVERTTDSKGPFFRLMDEGLDNDGDGAINEDPPRTRFISNRNYPAFWSSLDGSYRGAGDYPLQEHHSRILVDFIISRPHISMVESTHCASGIFVRPLGARPDSEIPLQDLRDYNAVLSKGLELTGYPPASLYHEFSNIEPELPPDRQPGARHGTFIDWTYWHRGLFSVTTELWSQEPFLNAAGWGDVPREKRLHSLRGNYRRPDVQTVMLKWLDEHKDDPDLAGQGFKDWRSFDHPTLGKVELGGFTRFWLFNGPSGPYFRRVIEDQARFSVYRALLTPWVRIQSVDVRQDPSDPKGWIIESAAANLGYLDTSMEQGRRTGVAKPDELVLILPEGARTEDSVTITFPFMWGTRGSTFHSLYEGTWRVRADSGTALTVEIRSEKGGVHRKEVVLTEAR